MRNLFLTFFLVLSFISSAVAEANASDRAKKQATYLKKDATKAVKRKENKKKPKRTSSKTTKIIGQKIPVRTTLKAKSKEPVDKSNELKRPSLSRKSSGSNTSANSTSITTPELSTTSIASESGTTAGSPSSANSSQTQARGQSDNIDPATGRELATPAIVTTTPTNSPLDDSRTLNNQTPNLQTSPDTPSSSSSTSNTDRADIERSTPESVYFDPARGLPQSNQSSELNENPIKQGPTRTVTTGSLIGSQLPQPSAENFYSVTNEQDGTYIPNQILLVSENMDKAKKLAVELQAVGAKIIRRSSLKHLGLVLSTFRLDPSVGVPQSIETIREMDPKLWVAANSVYQPLARRAKKERSNRQKLFTIVKRPMQHTCDGQLTIGMLDGPIEKFHTSLINQKIQTKSFARGGGGNVSNVHGTAVASLLVGSRESAGMEGVLPDAHLFAGNIMQPSPEDDDKSVATAESIVKGLNWLAEKRVSVINLSFGGGANPIFELVLKRLKNKGIEIVAAAGNGGEKASPSFPAAYDSVIAVSSIRFSNQLSSKSHVANYIDLVAPGENLWVAYKKNSGRYLSGSSFATPIVTGALAVNRFNGNNATQLFGHAIDLGEEGKDPKFGWGLLQYPQCVSK